MAECQDEQAVGRLRARAATQSRLPRGPWRQPIKPNGCGTSPAGAGLRWRELSSLPGAGAETRWREEQATGSLGNPTRRQDGGFARVAPPAGTGAAGGRVINLVTAAWPTLSPGVLPLPTPHQRFEEMAEGASPAAAGWPPFRETGVHVPSWRTPGARPLGQAGTGCWRRRKGDRSVVPGVSGLPPPGVRCEAL